MLSLDRDSIGINFSLQKELTSMFVIEKNWFTPYPWSEKFRKQLTPSITRGLFFISKVRDCNHTRFSYGNPGNTVPTIVPSYSPTRSPSVLPSTLPSHKPSSVPSLKPSKIPTSDPSQYPGTYPLQQHKHKQKHKEFLTKLPVLNVYIPSSAEINNINTKACYQNAQSYMCIYPLQ